MLDTNETLTIGNLARDPVLKTISNGSLVCNFTVAVSQYIRGKDGGEGRNITNYVDYECWDKLAEQVAGECKKGRLVKVNGDVRVDSWEDKETGMRKYKTKLRANQVKFGKPE